MKSRKRFFLPKQCLIRKSCEYNRIYREGNRHQGDGFSVIILENDLGHGRLGISIHRRLKGAVKRNRLKRIIREAFRLYREQFPSQCDVVVTVKPGFRINSPQDVANAVAELFGLNPVK